MQRVIPNIEELFFAARELTSAEQRSAFIGEVCRDTEVRRRVEALLAVDTEANDFLAALPSVPTVTVDGPQLALEEPGTLIGPYKLLEILGEGGMGVVYVAEQIEPVRRRVALKVIKPGMDTRQVVARFEAERQALAMMDHPNIAKVLDGGMTPSGRPYFVMELVRGMPITGYCDQHQLPITERLELFVLVCRAVQHAHQKGIIHRDLKPSNVLVTVIDGVGVPQVIDFGVAKATGQALTDKTVYTGFHQMVGTPLYMSPEQADLAGVDVDTRGDVYSLGVMLYELLTGTTPVESAVLKRAAWDEIRRILREVEPPRPSTRVGSLEAAVRTTVCEQRRTEPVQLRRQIHGELDWIVMKCLEKDRKRRYETANGLAADVLRYLTDRPVEACPPSTRYLLGKAARRHRTALTTAVLVGLTLVAGMAASAWQAVRAMTAERKTSLALVQAEEHLDLARLAVDELYDDVAARWMDSPRWSPLPRSFLEKALPFYRRFAESGKADTLTGRAHRRVGEILIQLGRRPEGRDSLRRAEAIFNGLVAADSKDPDHRHDLALSLSFVDATHAKAIPILEDLVRHHPETRRYREILARQLHERGVQLWQERKPQAFDHLQRARKLQEELLSASAEELPLQADLAQTLRDQGNATRDLRGRRSEAEAYQRRALELHQQLVAEHPTRPQLQLELAWSHWELGRTLIASRRYEEALPHAERAARILQALATEYPGARGYHDFFAQATGNVAACHYMAGRSAEGDTAVHDIEQIKDDAALALELAHIAGELLHGDVAENTQNERVMTLSKRSIALDPDSEYVGFAWHVLGVGQDRAGQSDEAIRSLERAVAYPRVADSFGIANGFCLAAALHHKGDHAQARAWYDRSLARMEEARKAAQGARQGVADPEELDWDLIERRDRAAKALGIDVEEGGR